MVVFSGESKKRKSDVTHDTDGGVERRKKRKRTSHSKKKKQEDVDSELEPEKPDQAMSIDHVPNDEFESPDNRLSKNKPVNLREAEKHGVKVDEEPSMEQLEDASTEKKAKKAKRKKMQSLKPSTSPVKVVVGDELSAPHKMEDNKSKYPDPGKDSSLAESTAKTLTYVYERLSSRSEWKFNKARQNWLIRNIWDDKVIPGLYFPSCLRYLKGVQGNSRDILIKECNSIIDEHSRISAQESAKAEGTVRFQEPQKPEDDIKLLRAQLILKKLSKKKDKQ